MKTSELRKWLENNDISYTETENEIELEYIIVGKKTQTMQISGVRFSDQNDTSFKLLRCIEYLNTPLNEREDEKKYNLKYNDTCFNFMDSWLVQGSDGKFWFSVFMEGKFTQQEIDNFPAEIKGAIDCGFLKKVEVKE